MATDEFPKHVAIIMDGNGRWAKKKNLPRVSGHEAGTEAVKLAIEFCLDNHIPVLTLFAFGQENWRRPADEVNFLMNLFFQTLLEQTQKLQEQSIQLTVIGNVSQLETKLQNKISEVQELTKGNDKLHLNLAVNYSGRWDILRGTKIIAEKINAGELLFDDVTEELFSRYLSLANFPDPDLFIRTSGEQRISNFLLWQLAYTEFYFTETFWPDFNKEEFLKACEFFATRERRFGCISEQLVED